MLPCTLYKSTDAHTHAHTHMDMCIHLHAVSIQCQLGGGEYTQHRMCHLGKEQCLSWRAVELRVIENCDPMVSFCWHPNLLLCMRENGGICKYFLLMLKTAVKGLCLLYTLYMYMHCLLIPQASHIFHRQPIWPFGERYKVHYIELFYEHISCLAI